MCLRRRDRAFVLRIAHGKEGLVLPSGERAQLSAVAAAVARAGRDGMPNAERVPRRPSEGIAAVTFIASGGNEVILFG